MTVIFLSSVMLLSTAGNSVLFAAPGADLWPRWEAHDPASTVKVDHSAWGTFLGKYLITSRPSGINCLRYGAVTPADLRVLAEYLDSLQEVEVSDLNRAEQKAFWINLYNALTVKVVLDHYPVVSIRDIDISPGWFSNGPWDAKLLTIEGQTVSLNDIEHRILRPIWHDNRVHYAVNCASLGCPNLQPEPFTAENCERLLERGARGYVNHPRGARIEGGRLTVSSIYDWFQVDFGGSEQNVIEHLRRFAESPLQEKLKGVGGIDGYSYDWSLNEP
ncbi:MAG: DUF547 domain-containing protein [Desulfuromonadales bacterium]|jgi:hypothetical protein